MILIKMLSSNLVVMAEDYNLTLDDKGVHSDQWTCELFSTYTAMREEYTGELPSGYLNGCWSFDGTWNIFPGCEDQVSSTIAEAENEIKETNSNKALLDQEAAIETYTKNVSKKALGLTVAEPDEVEFAIYIQALEADIKNPSSDPVYHPPVHPGVVVPAVGIDITMTRETGWADTLGWRLVFTFDEGDYVPANLAITVYSAADCTGYLYTPGALQLDTETGKYFALCPAGQEKGDVDYFFGLVYGSAPLACWTFAAGLETETINVI